MATMAANWRTTGQQEPRPRWLVNIGRGLAVLLGVAVGVAVLVAGGFLSLVTDCTGLTDQSSSTLCTDYRALVAPLEWMLVGAGFLLPTLGGIATCVTGRPRWLVAGLLAGALLFALVLAVAGLQASTLS